MNLLNNRDEFKELVELTSAANRLSELMVEKDYMVSILLERISKIDTLQIVFKGGTSLSKCYSVINRFSEDIDLTVLTHPNEMTNSNKKILKEEILMSIHDVGFELMNHEEIKSRMDYNSYKVKYPREFDDISIVKHNIVIDTIVAYEPYPCETRVVTNYILDFLEEHRDYPLLSEYWPKSFEMTVQSIDRTFIDKLFAICDYHLSGNYDLNSRHLYDIYKIWRSEFLVKQELQKLAISVSKDRQRFQSKNPSCFPGQNPNKILLEIIEKASYQSDYKNVSSSLITDDIEYDQCIQELKEIVESNILPSSIEEFEY